MEAAWSVLRSHALFFAITASTWFIGFIILIPITSYLDENESLQKYVGMIIVALLAIGGLIVYFVTLYKLLSVSLYPFLVYSITPIVTALLLIYWFIKNLRLGW